MDEQPPSRGAGPGRPSVVAVVPATDDPPTVRRCLDALRAGSRVPDRIVVQRRADAPGPAAARNAGAAGAGAELLLFVDADVEVHPDAVERLCRLFERDAGLAAAFGAYDDDPAAPGLTSRFRNLLHHHVHAANPGEAETFWAGLGAVRRGEFEAAGGFDAERFPGASVEDVELGMRLRERGARMLLEPAARGRHLKAWTLPSMVTTDFSRRAVPWARLLLARRDEAAGRGALNLGWSHRASAAACLLGVGAVLARRPRPALGAVAALFVLNRDLYALLWRRGGARLLAAGVALHVVHHLTAAAALPVALAAHLREGGS